MTGIPHIFQQRISVPFKFPVVFTNHVFAPKNRALVDALSRLGEERRHRAMVYIDSSVLAATPELPGLIQAYFTEHADKLELAEVPQIVPGGEEIKNEFSYAEKMIN